MGASAVISTTFTIPGDPRGKGRPRSGKSATGKTVHYTDAATKAYEEKVGFMFLASGGRRIDGPVEVRITAQFVKPKSCRETHKVSRPDIDNVVKAVLDGLNKIAFTDDAQVVSLSAFKEFSEVAQVRVNVSEVLV